MRLIFLCLFSVLLSCATEAPPVAQKTEKPPYYRRYKKKDQELIYVVTRLSDAIDSETQTYIDDSIRRFDPEILVTKYPIDNRFDFDKDLAACESKLYCTTSAWTCLSGQRHGISCETGEPYNTEQMKEMLKFVKGTAEVLFFYTYRSLVFLSPGKKDPLEGIDTVIEDNKKLLHLSNDFDRNDFIRIYKEKVGPRIVIGKSNLKDDEKGNYLQRLSFIEKKSYLNLMYRKFQEEQSAHKRVMVVYDPWVFKALEERLRDDYSGHIP